MENKVLPTQHLATAWLRPWHWWSSGRVDLFADGYISNTIM